MDREGTRILLVEGDPDSAAVVSAILEQVAERRFRLDWAPCLSAALAQLVPTEFGVVLLDLNLPDSRGLETFVQVSRHAPDVPVIVLSGLGDESLAAEAIRQGAQDYLVKGQMDSRMLVRAVSNAIERERVHLQLRNLLLLDDLTGLYNRRGFRALAEQELRMALRTRVGYLLVYADVDDLKGINDTFGHPEGDRALIEASNVLKRSFRESDILARLGGDEFSALAIGVQDAAGTPILSRVREALREVNTVAGRRYPLSLSIGVARYEPDCFFTVDALLASADRALYEQKRRHRARLLVGVPQDRWTAERPRRSDREVK